MPSKNPSTTRRGRIKVKLLIENWQKFLNENVVDFPSEATASERYKNYLMHMDSAIKQIKSLEEIFNRQGRTTEELVQIRESLERLRDDETLKFDIADIGGNAYDAGVTINAPSINSAADDYIQVTGIGTIASLGVSGVTTSQHLKVTGISTLGTVSSLFVAGLSTFSSNVSFASSALLFEIQKVVLEPGH